MTSEITPYSSSFFAEIRKEAKALFFLVYSARARYLNWIKLERDVKSYLMIA